MKGLWFKIRDSVSDLLQRGVKYGVWFRTHYCVKCKEVITDNMKMNSNGCCPKCGYIFEGTIIDTVDGSARRIFKGRLGWWKETGFEYKWENGDKTESI